MKEEYEGLNHIDVGRFIILITKATKKDLYKMEEMIHEEVLQRIQLEARDDLRTGN